MAYLCICCLKLFQIFDDAYKSPFSCVIIDDIERLLGESFVVVFLSVLVSSFQISPETYNNENPSLEGYISSLGGKKKLRAFVCAFVFGSLFVAIFNDSL